MKNQKNKKKLINDKEYSFHRYVGYWCLKEDVICEGDCDECTIKHFPGIKEQLEKDKKIELLKKLEKERRQEYEK